ncbi:MAG: family 78 glycoside hydrolase catalytic domain [Verrucomicrobia bacterium]|jgi:alpha-L-rhamnosidase|nr:family 78 glycoside hydrolase catalytic domain [Verrucomicrobiota bacterium]
MSKTGLSLFMVFGMSFGLWSESTAASAAVTGLQCEYRAEPLGIDVLRPRLGWQMKSVERGQHQTAYQVLVASSPSLLEKNSGDLWDSGKVPSPQSIQVVYSGTPLVSGQRCYWKVRVWPALSGVEGDQDGKPASWSAPARWTMGLLNPQDWKAEWIGFFPKESGQEGTPAPYFRKTFTLDGAAEHAFATVNAQGYYELYVNGRKVDDHLLSPAVSDFSKRNLYITHDIRSYLQPGTNCVALWLGRGWYSKGIPGVDHDGPIARAQLDIETDGGSPAQVVTDGSWKAHTSPLTITGKASHSKHGADIYDATREIPGWNEAVFDDGAWPNAQVVSSHPGAVTTAQAVEPNRATDTIKPITIKTMEDGSYLIDMGRDFTGVFEVVFPKGGKAGTVVSMECCESGAPKRRVGLSYSQEPRYTFRGSGEERFRMRFTYHGFRYIRMRGAPDKPNLEDITGHLVESDLPQAGSFRCSNDLFNRIHEMTSWTIRCLNLGGNTVDCPHRERLGYGDGQVVLEPLMYNHHSASLYYKWHVDWRDAQNPETGAVPNVVPFFMAGAGGGPAWGGTIVPMAWYQYRHYGDTRILEEALPSAKAYLEFFESKSRDNILEFYGLNKRWFFLGDWVPPGGGQERGGKFDDKTSTLFFNNCYRLYLSQLTARMAEVLGKTADVEQLNAKIEKLRSLLHERFYNPETKSYVCGKQTYLAFPLMIGLPPPEERAAIMAKLEKNIRGADKGHINAGMLGGYFMFDYLSSIDRDDLISLIVGQTTYPSWGYMLEQGATTCWEQWNGVFSHIHSCFVWVDLWFYEGLAGIHRDPDIPGFKHVIIKPKMVDDVTWVECHHDSPYGRIVSNWKRDEGKVTMDVTIPANSTATVYVPAREASDVRESGRQTDEAEGVEFFRMENGRAVYGVGSGAYNFTSSM